MRMLLLNICIGLDSCMIPLTNHNLSLIQTTDFFYPLINDPYMMGKITCANVLSDLYAMGVTECDNLIMLLSVCTQMKENERDIIMPLVVQGFRDNAYLAGLKPICRDSVYNPWCIIGGIATSICQSDEFILPYNSKPGDILILTKPLGPQMACNIYRWCENDDDRWKKISNILSKDDVQTTYRHAVVSMARLNRTAARLMHKYDAHAATDVTGFGLLGHCNNLAETQKTDVKFVIHTIPIIAKILAVATTLGNANFAKGTTPETSGGLLICLPKENGLNFCNEILQEDGWPAWIIGDVVEGNKSAEIIDSPTIIEVNHD